MAEWWGLHVQWKSLKMHSGGELCLNLSCCVHKVTNETLKGDTTCTGVSGLAKLFVQTKALVWEKKMWKSHIVWRTPVNSGLCVIYLWLINIMCIFEGLLGWDFALQADINSSSWWFLNIVSRLTVPSSLKENYVIFMKSDSFLMVRLLFCCCAKDIWILKHVFWHIFILSSLRFNF